MVFTQPGVHWKIGGSGYTCHSAKVEDLIIRVSLRHVLATVLPPRLYHGLLTRVAYRFAASAQSLQSSVIFPYPFGDREHYVLVPKRFIRSAFALSQIDAVAIERDLRLWVKQADWSSGNCLQMIVNYGKYQETPFLHVHVITEDVLPGSPDRAPLGQRAWFVGITDGRAGHGRRVVYHCPGHDDDTVTDHRK